MFENIYKGKKVLVTGHCGFKGSWLVHWLKSLGAEVIGIGHKPSTLPSHHYILGETDPLMEQSNLLYYENVNGIVSCFHPELIIHLASKAIVARTFTEPRETFENNVMGAVNILEAARQCKSVKGIVIITTDKIYEDKNWSWGYRENDEMGGVDPYSASKVCVEQVIRCYRESFGMNIATARAGNVIGGGDWSFKRLIPDIVRAATVGEKVTIHTPYATRPWQHVLDALCGYLLLGKHIIEGNDVNRSFNFGPMEDMRVIDILNIAHDVWPKVEWEIDPYPTHPHMVYLLKLDSTESRNILGWRNRWSIEQSVVNSILWYRAYYERGIVNTDIDIDEYKKEM